MHRRTFPETTVSRASNGQDSNPQQGEEEARHPRAFQELAE